MGYPIDDLEMTAEIATDLILAHEFEKEEAKKLAKVFAPYIIDKMWDEYSEALSYMVGQHENA